MITGTRGQVLGDRQHGREGCRAAEAAGHVTVPERPAVDAGEEQVGEVDHPSAPTGIGANRASAMAAETEHDTNPLGYCGLGGTGVSCPLGITAAAGPATPSTSA